MVKIENETAEALQKKAYLLKGLAELAAVYRFYVVEGGDKLTQREAVEEFLTETLGTLSGELEAITKNII